MVIASASSSARRPARSPPTSSASSWSSTSTAGRRVRRRDAEDVVERGLAVRAERDEHVAERVGIAEADHVRHALPLEPRQRAGGEQRGLADAARAVEERERRRGRVDDVVVDLADLAAAAEEDARVLAAEDGERAERARRQGDVVGERRQAEERVARCDPEAPAVGSAAPAADRRDHGALSSRLGAASAAKRCRVGPTLAVASLCTRRVAALACANAPRSVRGRRAPAPAPAPPAVLPASARGRRRPNVEATSSRISRLVAITARTPAAKQQPLDVARAVPTGVQEDEREAALRGEEGGEFGARHGARAPVRRLEEERGAVRVAREVEGIATRPSRPSCVKARTI